MIIENNEEEGDGQNKNKKQRKNELSIVEMEVDDKSESGIKVDNCSDEETVVTRSSIKNSDSVEREGEWKTVANQKNGQKKTLL